MGIVSEVTKFLKDGKTQLIAKLKQYAYIAIGIAIYVIIVGIILAAVHFFMMLAKNVAPLHTCPYNYSSFGLDSENAGPILGAMVDNLVGIVYSNNGGEKKGLLNGYRDGILGNNNFQIVRIICVVFAIALLGISFTFGFVQLTGSEALKKLAIIGMFVFVTDANSYLFYDYFLEPLVLVGGKQLAGMLNGALLATMDSPEIINYVKNNPNNEFVLLDASITIFFSNAIFNKLGALVFTSAAFLFVAPIFYLIAGWITLNYFLFTVIVIFYKIVVLMGLALFPMFALFSAMAIVGGSVDKTTQYFTNYVKEMLIKPTISVVLLTYVMSFIVALILELILGLFSFEVCVFNQITWPVGLNWFLPDFDYYEAVRPFISKDVFGKIIAFNPSDLDLPASDPNTMVKKDNFTVLFDMMFLNVAFLTLFAILFRKIQGVVIEISDSLMTALGGSSLGGGEKGGFKDLHQLGNKIEDKGLDLAAGQAKKGIDAVGEGAKFTGEVLGKGLAETGSLMYKGAKQEGAKLYDAAKDKIGKLFGNDADSTGSENPAIEVSNPDGSSNPTTSGNPAPDVSNPADGSNSASGNPAPEITTPISEKSGGASVARPAYNTNPISTNAAKPESSGAIKSSGDASKQVTSTAQSQSANSTPPSNLSQEAQSHSPDSSSTSANNSANSGAKTKFNASENPTDNSNTKGGVANDFANASEGDSVEYVQPVKPKSIGIMNNVQDITEIDETQINELTTKQIQTSTSPEPSSEVNSDGIKHTQSEIDNSSNEASKMEIDSDDSDSEIEEVEEVEEVVVEEEAGGSEETKGVEGMKTINFVENNAQNTLNKVGQASNPEVNIPISQESIKAESSNPNITEAKAFSTSGGKDITPFDSSDALDPLKNNASDPFEKSTAVNPLENSSAHNPLAEASTGDIKPKTSEDKLEKLNESIEKAQEKVAFMKQVAEAKKKTNFINKNIEAVSNAKQIAKLREKMGYNKDKK